MILQGHRVRGKHLGCQNLSFLEILMLTRLEYFDTFAPGIPRFFPGDQIFDTRASGGVPQLTVHSLRFGLILESFSQLCLNI